jgi:hypothetical protein
MAYLEGLAGLRFLDLSGTTVGDAGLAHLRGLSGLTDLFLEGTKVGDAGLARLGGLPASDICDSAIPRSETRVWPIWRG